MFRILADAIEQRVSSRSLTWVAAVFFLCAVIGVVRSVGDGGSSPKPVASPTTLTTVVVTTAPPETTTALPAETTTTEAAPTTTTAPPRVPLAGFETIAMAVNGGGGAKSFCSLLAGNDDQRAKGLMGQQNLGGFDAMVFRFDSNTTAQFFMANVPIPLSVAWFDERGNFVSSADMALCTTEAAQCPHYGATGPYRYAVEVPQGQLGALGIGAGSTISLGLACA